MKKRKWVGLLLIIIIAITWFTFFYKTYSERYVAYNADHIICLDTKKITNTIIWQYITTPSQWKKMSFRKKKKKEPDWKDLINLPDYAFIFHSKGQPANAWYTVLEIKNPESFTKNISKLNFKKTVGNERYISSTLGVELIRSGNQILIANANVKDKNLIANVAADLFKNGNHIERQKLSENINAKAHLSWCFFGNGSVKNADGVINIEKNQITATLNLGYDNQYVIIQQKEFQVSDSAQLSLAMIRPPEPVYKLIPQEVKQKLTRLINFNVDSLFQPGINYWQAEIAGFNQKMDTAISYDYDDNFNQIEKKVVNIVTQPDLCLTFYGGSVNELYSYWQDSAVLQSTEQGELFTPIPFVKTYASINGDNELKLQSRGFKSNPKKWKSDAGILYAFLNLHKAPDALMKYAPKKIEPFVKKLSYLKLTAESNIPGDITMQVIFKKKDDSFWFN